MLFSCSVEYRATSSKHLFGQFLNGVLRSSWEEGLEVGPTFLAPIRALLVARPCAATPRTPDTSPLLAQRRCRFAPPRSRPTRRTGPHPHLLCPEPVAALLASNNRNDSKSTQQPCCGAQRSTISYILRTIFRPRGPLRGCLPHTEGYRMT
jgi:hypothetical protein